MNVQLPISLDRAFVPAGTPSFADLIDDLTRQGDLFPSRQRDMISGLKRVAKALGLPPGDVPADAKWLQPRLAKISAARLGLTPKTWLNIVSNARAAMVKAGIVERRHRRIDDLSPEWRALWEVVLASRDEPIQRCLCRFVHFLSWLGVAPNEVTLDHAYAFLRALEVNEIGKDPQVALRAAVEGWNRAAERIPGWPQQRLALPSRQVVYQLPRDTFPAAFIADLDRLIAWLGEPDVLEDETHRRALRPETCKQYRTQLMRFASEVVHAGVPVEELTSVRDLLDPGRAETGLRQMLARNDKKTSRLISETARLLSNLANKLEAPEETRTRLIKLAGKVAVRPQVGMTEKNRSRLRVLQDPANQIRVLNLPDRIFARPLGDGGARAIFAREDALAIAILLNCPIRAKSLAGLDLRQHIQRPGDGKVYLVLEEADTKTGRPIEFELPRDVVRLLDAHLKTRSPHMCPPGTPYLFPQRSGARPVDPSGLAGRIAKRVRRETGFEMNAHLFRHFAVMLWLDANPGGYEVARRLLGHSELSHTINMYSGLEVRTATMAFSDLVADRKAGRR